MNATADFDAQVRRQAYDVAIRGGAAAARLDGMGLAAALARDELRPGCQPAGCGGYP